MSEYADTNPSVDSQGEHVSHSSEYDYARAVIEEGIAKSEAKGYGVIKVEFFTKNDDLPGGGIVERMEIAEFFGSNALFKMVTPDEFRQLLIEFDDKLPPPSHHDQPQSRAMGSIAMQKNGPVPHIVTNRGEEFMDIKSLLAHDDTFKD